MKITYFILIILFNFQLNTCAIANECIENLPGKISANFDDPKNQKITKIKISRRGEMAYVVTSYYGWSNFQAAVYLNKDAGYCFSGDLGAAIDFKTNARKKVGKFYGLDVIANHGDRKAVKSFVYEDGQYKFASCRFIPPSSDKNCSD